MLIKFLSDNVETDLSDKTLVLENVQGVICTLVGIHSCEFFTGKIALRQPSVRSVAREPEEHIARLFEYARLCFLFLFFLFLYKGGLRPLH